MYAYFIQSAMSVNYSSMITSNQYEESCFEKNIDL